MNPIPESQRTHTLQNRSEDLAKPAKKSYLLGMLSPSLGQARFRKFSLALVLYTVLVILWGAWVRISRSGAGCGEHWPLCHGELIPGTSVPATWIEFSHRLSTGLYGILVAALVFMAFRYYPKRSSVRIASGATAFFTLVEAWIGARLVLSGWVADDASLYRAVFMALHQINSMLLSGSVFLAWLTSKQTSSAMVMQRGTLWAFLKSPRGRSSVLVLCLVLVVSMAGAVASLAGTLFPSETLVEGLQKDLSESSHPVLRYRIWHPLLAVSVATALVALFWPNPNIQGTQLAAARRHFLIAMGVTVGFGSLTLLLLSPIWMKLVHLLLAHGTWFSALTAAHACTLKAR